MAKEKKTSQEKDLLVVATKSEDVFTNLDMLMSEVPNMSTKTLANSYEKLKPFEKTVTELVKGLRNELVEVRFERLAPIEETEDGVEVKYLVPVDYTLDEKGSKYMTLDSGKRLKAEKRSSLKMNEEDMKLALKAYEAYDMATDIVYTVKDMVALNAMVEQLIETSPEDMKARYREKMAQLIVVDKKLNETKIEALVSLGNVPLEAIEKCYTQEVSYALKVVK